MERWSAAGAEVHYDRAANLAAYAQITAYADRCTCTTCENFAAQRATVYPEAFLRLLAEIGIDPLKEGEAWEITDKDRVHLYGGCFHFIGKVTFPGYAIKSGGFEYWFSSRGQVVRAPDAFGESWTALEFTTRLPWVIDKPEP